MWTDAEAHNELLKDLLHKYAVDLDNKANENERLKSQIRELKHELQYYKGHSFVGSILDTPEIVEVPKITTASFNLYIPTASTSIEDNPYDGAYHIIAKIRDKNTISYNYYVTKTSLLQAKDRIGILTYLHKKVLEEMERQLDKQYKGF